MLHYQRQSFPEDPHRYHHLDRAGYSGPGPRRSSIVDISNLIESRRPLSSEGKRSLLSSQQSSTQTPFTPPVASRPSEPGGGPVRSPPQLPPVSSIQLHPPPPPPPVLPQYGAQQGFAPVPPPYYTSPPTTSALPPYHQQPLPSIAAATQVSYGPPPPPPELPTQTLAGTKRSAEGVPRSSPPPPSKKHHGKWTEEEDNLAIELRRRGMKWDDIAKRIPGRSAISCRLRYQNYSEKRPNWDEEKKNKLARLYNRFKRDMWEMVATEMGLPWRAVEAMHWQMGQEEMASRANVPVFQPHAGGSSSGQGFDEEDHLGTTPPPSAAFSERYGPGIADLPASGLRARRSSSVGSRRAASMAMERPPVTHSTLPSLTEPTEYSPPGRASHAHTQSQPQNVHERRYSTLPPLAPLSDPGRPDVIKGNTYPTPSTAQSHHYSYPSSSSTAQMSVPGLTAAGSPSTYQASEAYGTPSPRTFYGRSTEERSTLGNGTPMHNRQASQGSVRSTRSLAYGSLAASSAGIPVTNGGQWTSRFEESGSAPNSASVGRRMSIPGVRRNSIALPPPK